VFALHRLECVRGNALAARLRAAGVGGVAAADDSVAARALDGAVSTVAQQLLLDPRTPGGESDATGVSPGAGSTAPGCPEAQVFAAPRADEDVVEAAAREAVHAASLSDSPLRVLRRPEAAGSVGTSADALRRLARAGRVRREVGCGFAIAPRKAAISRGPGDTEKNTHSGGGDDGRESTQGGGGGDAGPPPAAMQESA
jgi:hypothetical protein